MQYHRACSVRFRLGLFALLVLVYVGGNRPAHAQEANPIHKPSQPPQQPSQAPTAGQGPFVHEGSFDMAVHFNVALAKVQQALRGAGLTAQNKGTAELWATSDHVAVLVTCAGLPNGHTTVVVVSASTESATAEFYRNDIRTRIQAANPLATPSGEAAAPTRGSSVAIQWGSFDEENTNLFTADKALAAAGLTVHNKDSVFHDAQNAHVTVVVTWAEIRARYVLVPDNNRIVAIALSTDSAIAEYYRNTVRTTINPPSPPVYVR